MAIRTKDVAELEALVAHRELEHLRSIGDWQRAQRCLKTPSRWKLKRYIERARKRGEKLLEARKALEEAKQTAKQKVRPGT